ncbi:MAG: O-antigen ligase family protein, partial [Bryobacterales bacterium]|nr:O-antigen ligase family protein [Bryobacterales bacterium]
YGLVLTRSRGAAIGLAVMIALAVRDRLGKTGAWVMSALIAAGLLAANFGGARALSLREASIAGRLEAWSAGLQMLKNSPLFGVGFRAFTDHHELTAHNSFVLCFAETGMAGYFLWLGLLVATARDLNILSGLSAAEPAQAEARRWARAVRLAYYTFLATSWFLSRTYIPTLYLLIAMVVGLREMARQNGWARLPGLDRRWLTVTVAAQFLSVTLIYVTVRLRSL